jgi:hypothetical protein
MSNRRVTNRKPSLPDRFFWSVIGAVCVNVFAFGLIAYGFAHLDARGAQAQSSDFVAFMFGFLVAAVGVGWSIGMTVYALVALFAHPDPDDPSLVRRPRHDHRDAVAILAVNLTILLGWSLLIYGQFVPPPDHGWW